MESVRLVLASPKILLEHGLGGRVCPLEEDALRRAVLASPCERLDGRFLNAALGDGHRAVRRQALKPRRRGSQRGRCEVCVGRGRGGLWYLLMCRLSLKNEYYKYLIAYSWVADQISAHE